MKKFFANYGWYLIEVISGLLVIGLLMSLFTNSDIKGSDSFLSLSQTVVGANVDYTIPTVEEGDFIVENGIIDKDSVFNWKDFVSVNSTNGIDLIDYISISGDRVDTSVPGKYEIVYTLNWNGNIISKVAYIYVRDSF